MIRLLLVASALLAPTLGWAQGKPSDSVGSVAEEEIRRTLRQYDVALQHGDPQAVGQFWADEYTFVNPAGERLTKSARLANLRTRRTRFDTLRPQLREEQIRVYGDVAVYTTLTTLAGQYSGRVHQGDYQALVVLVKRAGRWQQVASQLTRVNPR
jgi:ketosteroid isomerase-like protein